jgi:2-polyprenyl-3-methyl-5-hydroxy-6-metoxy-1,4-benzoquinol methylase
VQCEAEARDLAALTRETQELWDGKADFWDAQMGEGNAFHRVLVGPAAERLLAPQVGETFLDVACGNGQFARRLAQFGARVVATDFSATFLDRARVRTTENAERIDYRLVDATDEAQLLALGVGRFDGAVCNMALMDMTTIAPLLRALAQLIKPGGRFVFAVPHPSFNSNATRLALEEEDRGGELHETRSVRVNAYLHIPPGKGDGDAR